MLFLLCTCLLWLSPGRPWTAQAQGASTHASPRAPHRSLAPSNVDFAFSLYRHLVAANPSQTVFLSPVSVSTALAMLSLGARDTVRAQILQGLNFNLTEISEAEIHQSFQHLLKELDSSLEMTLGNALFLDRSLELQALFSANTRRYYNLEVITTDLRDRRGTGRHVNEYLQNKTQGKISDVSLELKNPVVFILLNYIFFTGTWVHPFDPKSTREENFYVNETSIVKVPMMFQSRVIKYLDDQVLPCQLVQLDYVGNGTAFFILPDKGRLATVINALSRDTIQRWSKSLTRSRVNLYLPKVTISGVHDLGGIMADMGIADPLSSQTDFSGVTQEARLRVAKDTPPESRQVEAGESEAPAAPTSRLHVAPPPAALWGDVQMLPQLCGGQTWTRPIYLRSLQVVHKAVLRFEEKGATAAVSTREAPGVMAKPLTLRFNRPFIFTVFDNFTWSPLFVGKVLNPSGGAPPKPPRP